jgi:hypothetical protein
VNRYAFLTDTYATERLKILAAWAMFRDGEMTWKTGSSRPDRS